MSAATELRPAESADGENLIFVTGASRSGTTMLARILGNAGGLSLKELHYFGDLVAPDAIADTVSREFAENAAAMLFARQSRDYWAKEPNAEDREKAKAVVDTLADDELVPSRLFAACIHALLEEAGKPFAIEQTPRNIYYAASLLDTYPGARVISVVRDPRAVLASQKARHKLRKLGGSGVPIREVFRLLVNYHPVSMTRLWKSAVNAAQALSAHERFFIVRYEDLVADDDAAFRELFAALGLKYHPAFLAVPHYGSSVTSHTSKEGLSKKSVDKWKENLNGTEIRYSEAATREERKAFDYPEYPEARYGLAGLAGFALRAPLHAVGLLILSPRVLFVQLRAMLQRSGGGA